MPLHSPTHCLLDMAGSNEQSKVLPKKKMTARFGKKSRPGKDSGSKNSPQRSRLNTDVYAAPGGCGLMVVTVDKEMNGEPSFIGDLTKAVDDDQSFCEEQGFLGCYPLMCAESGSVRTFKTASNKTFARKGFVFWVESDKDVREKLSNLCKLFSKVTKPYVSRTGVAGRPHLGVPGKITGSVGSADLPTIIAAVGPYKTAHVVGCLHHGELLEGSMDFDLLPDYFEKFDREFAEKLVIEAFEEDTGLKVGSGDAENYEDKEGQDTIEKAEETETTKEDEEKLGKEDDKEDKEEEN